MNKEIQTYWNSISEILLKKAGISDSFTLASIAGGRNNKVFKLETRHEVFLLKSYFYHPNDSRDRLGQEFAFLEYLQAMGSRYAAAPYAKDILHHLGLMEFIKGERPSLETITKREIEHAGNFFIELNKENTTLRALELKAASEACFSFEEHVATTQKRIDRLSGIIVLDDIDSIAVDFTKKEILPSWSEIKNIIEHKASNTYRSKLTLSERCLSPSDFGFHNTLKTAENNIRFVDFEYAGWDDPAKLISDFANQPDMLLPRELSDYFKSMVINRFERKEALNLRVSLLGPLYQIKWACICLNDFLQIGRSRRNFTDGDSSKDLEKRIFQLNQAKVMLKRISKSCL